MPPNHQEGANACAPLGREPGGIPGGAGEAPSAEEGPGEKRPSCEPSVQAWRPLTASAREKKPTGRAPKRLYAPLSEKQGHHRRNRCGAHRQRRAPQGNTPCEPSVQTGRPRSLPGRGIKPGGRKKRPYAPLRAKQRYPGGERPTAKTGVRPPRDEHSLASRARLQPGNAVTNPGRGRNPASLSRRRKTANTGAVSKLAQPGRGPGNGGPGEIPAGRARLADRV